MANPLPSLRDILSTPGPAAVSATTTAGLPSLKDVLATPGPASPQPANQKGLPKLSDVLPAGSGGQLPSLKDLLATPGPVAPAKKGGGGILGTLEHVVTQGGSDLYHAAINTPAGVAAVYHALDEATKAGWSLDDPHLQPLKDLAKGYEQSVVESVKHPLRNPGYTLLNALPVAGAVAKVGLVGKLAKAGEVSGPAQVTKALVSKLPPAQRTLKVGDMTVRGHYSPSASSQLVQRGVDAGLQKASQGTSRVALKAEDVLHKRAAKWEARNQRVADAVARAPGTRLQVLGRSLKPAELRALRLVAEETPVARRLGAQEMRMARATGKEVARHQERINLTKAASEFLDAHPTTGKPIFKPSATKLQKVYDALKVASTDREGMLKNLGLMDEAAQQAAKTKIAQVAAGGRYVKPEEAAAKAAALERTGSATSDFLDWSKGYLDRSTTRRVRVASTTVDKAEAAAFNAGTRRTAAETEALQAAKQAQAETRQAVAPVDTAADASRARRVKLTAAIERKAAQVHDLSDKATFALVRVSEGARPHSHAAQSVAALHKARTELDSLRAAARRETRTGGDVSKQQTLQGVAHEARTTIAQEKLGSAERDAQQAYRDALAHLESTRRAREGAVGRTRAVDWKMRRLAEAAAEKSDAAVQAARDQAGRVVGAEDITASPEAVFIGNPVERARLTGKPKVSSTGTFGHTQKPSSLKTSTGASVEHALERQDVTNIVAERHAEAVRLSTIDRVRDRVKQAGEQAPRRKDDVFVWTDKLISNERIPKEVRRYLDNPESLASLPPDQRLSVTEQIKQAVFEKRDWRDPAAVAEFTQLAQEGKGVFVPRRLLGSYGKRDVSLSSVPGVEFVDAVNNAQKAGLIYLKLNYPIVQGLSNTAMSIIHQGFAAPVRLTQAVKLDRAIGADFAAITDDIMGSGAVMQAAFEGQGTVSRMTQKLAHFMSNKVDTPARRAAMLHEAHKAGFGTAERYKMLLTDDRYAGDLAEVAQRAVEAIVDYGELSPFERNVVRRLIFVYPWQKGATKYAGHFLRDHPVQAAALGLTSQQADQSLGPRPSYLDGAFKAGGGLVNPSGVNFFQTPAQIGQALAGAVTGNTSTSSQLQNFLAPAPSAITGLLTGRDDLGRPLKGNIAAKLRDLLVAPTPAAGVARAAGSQSDLIKALAGDRTSSKSFPNPSDAYYRFLLGGLYPRDYNRDALNRAAALQKSGR